MKTAWLFGGSRGKFGKSIVNGIDVVIPFGRYNVDYSNIDGFLESIENDTITYPIPDIIIFNISNHGHIINLDKVKTEKSEIEFLNNFINSTFYFQLRLTEWFFHNFKNKRILWITSFQPYAMENTPDTDSDGDLLLYRMTRALEHQVIFQQNILKHNIDNNNIIMGTCVGNNIPPIVEYLNKIILNNEMIRGVYGLSNDSPNTNLIHTIDITNIKLFK